MAMGIALRIEIDKQDIQYWAWEEQRTMDTGWRNPSQFGDPSKDWLNYFCNQEFSGPQILNQKLPDLKTSSALLFGLYA